MGENKSATFISILSISTLGQESKQGHSL